MKILVPTDFSECADFALSAACQLAQVSPSEIKLLHVAVTPSDLSGVASDESMTEDMRKNLLKDIEILLEERSKYCHDSGVKIDTEYTHGKFIEEVLAIDEREDFDLVVMGSYGKSGKRDWFIGSNTQKLVRKLDKNVLVIKNPVEKLSFDKVLFPSNLTNNDKKAFLSFLDFIEPFDAKEVHLLAVNTGSWFTQPGPMMLELLEDFKALVDRYECHTHFKSDYSVEAGIRHFTEKYDVKLIGISNLGKNPVKRLLQGSNVELLVNQSELPVLAISRV
jgi:nucleotide-binding universal stress UspA family protein